MMLILFLLGKTTEDNYVRLLEVVYGPLVPYISNYGTYELKILGKKFSGTKFIMDELSDTIQALNLSLPLIMDLARDAKRRCTDITENYGYCGLLKALRSFFVNYADQYRVALRQLNRNTKNAEDWNSFQLCFSLLQVEQKFP